VKVILRVLIFMALIAETGCDPAINIYQVKVPTPPPAPGGVQAKLTIKATHQLIGESWYRPEISMTNFSSSTMVVTGVELVTQKGLYSNQLQNSDRYPLTVSPGAAVVLDVHFDLRNGVRTTFAKSAELRVHYRIENKDEIAKTRLAARPL